MAESKKGSFSLTIKGVVVMVLVLLAEGAGVELGPEALESFLLIGGKLVSVAMVYWGRVRKGDINLLGLRK